MTKFKYLIIHPNVSNQKFSFSCIRAKTLRSSTPTICLSGKWKTILDLSVSKFSIAAESNLFWRTKTWKRNDQLPLRADIWLQLGAYRTLSFVHNNGFGGQRTMIDSSRRWAPQTIDLRNKCAFETLCWICIKVVETH